eukprot:tig00001042_g6597.t1
MRRRAAALVFLAALLVQAIAQDDWVKTDEEVEKISREQEPLTIYKSRSVVGDAEALATSAANVPVQRVLDFLNFAIDVNSTSRSSAARLADIGTTPDALLTPGTFVLQFAGPEVITHANIEAVQKIVGHDLTEYVPHDGYVFGATGPQAKQVRVLPFIKYVGRMLPQMKLSDQLKNLDELVATTDIKDELEAAYRNTTVVGLLSPRPKTAGELAAIRDRLAAALAKRGIAQPLELLDEGVPSLTVTVPTRLVDLVAVPMCSEPEVQWVQAKKVMRLKTARLELRSEAAAAGAREEEEGAPGTGRALLNSKAAGFLQSGSLFNEVVWNKGITGKGQIVGIGDSGVDWDNCLFYDKDNTMPFFSPTGANGLPRNPASAHRKFVGYRPFDTSSAGIAKGYRSDDTDGHGSHVAGSVLGYSATLMNKGMAYEARMVFSDYGADDPNLGLAIPASMDLQAAYDLGARIHTNSWGCAPPGADMTYCNKYDSQPLFVDRFMWLKPDFLVLFAAGNDGSYGARTVGSPATCKNCLSVGALDVLSSTGAIKMASFSSQGPTGDMRYKPDIASPGSNIQSAASDGDVTSMNCGLKGMYGTSMATPIAAGTAALVRQYLVEGWYPSGIKTAANAMAAPPAALIKAMMIHSTVPVTKGPKGETLDSPPDFKQGFGAPRLSNVLYFPESAFKLKLYHDNVPRCGEKQYFFEVGGKRDFVVTLVWTDPPGTASAANTLVNDLDLEVKEANPGFVPMFYPNRRTSADRTNNVEKIVLTPRATFTRADGTTYGRYAVVVRGTGVAVQDQNGITQQAFALVVTGDSLVEVPLAQGFKPSRPTCVNGIVNGDAFPPYPATNTFAGSSKTVTVTLAKPLAEADWTAATYEAWAGKLAADLGIPADVAASMPSPVNVIEMTRGSTKVVFDLRPSMMTAYFPKAGAATATRSDASLPVQTTEQALDEALNKLVVAGYTLGKGYAVAGPASFSSAVSFSTSISAVSTPPTTLPSSGTTGSSSSSKTSGAPGGAAARPLGALGTGLVALVTAALALALARRHS